MALLEILKFPDPRLRNKAKKITKVNKSIQKLANDMLETMYNAPGIGLAAPQVNINQRLIVVDISEQRNEPQVFINPEFEIISGNQQCQEGCLSVPDFYETVTRADHIKVSALDLKGKPFELECDGLLSVCVQHEIDHLNGKLFIDYLSELKRQKVRKIISKQKVS